MAIKFKRWLFWAWVVFALPWVVLWLGFFVFFPPPDPGWSWSLFLNAASVLLIPPLGFLVFGRFILWVFSGFRSKAAR